MADRARRTWIGWGLTARNVLLVLSEYPCNETPCLVEKSSCFRKKGEIRQIELYL